MDHKAFYQKIKGNSLLGAYILHGPEEFIKDSALQRVIDLVDPSVRAVNVDFMEAAQSDPIIDACETLPFFSERRILVCRQLPKDEDSKVLCDYLPRLPETTLLLFVIRGKANEKLNFFKFVSKAGGVVSFDSLDEDEVIRWMLQHACDLQVTIAPEAARHIVHLVGTDMSRIYNEFQKVAGFVGPGNEVTIAAADAAVSRTTEYRVFDMLDRFLAGDAASGMRALDGLIQDGEPPMRIASFLAGRFKLMLRARHLMDQKLSEQAAVRAMGGSPYAAKLAYRAAKRFEQGQLLNLLRDFSQVGYLQVSGQAKDRDALEQAIFRNLLQTEKAPKAL